MSAWEASAAAAVIGLAGFQLLETWNANAPSLSDMRQADHSDNVTKTQLKDADFLVGGMALILGTTYAVLTKDGTALIVMLSIYGSVSLWWHAVARAEPATNGSDY